MNFAKEIKKEILSKPAKERCCKRAFLAGLIRGTGQVFSDGENLGLDFTVKDEEIATLASSLFSLLYRYEIREVSVSEDRLNKKDKFVLSISGESAQDILEDLGIIVSDGEDLAINLKNYGKITEKECCLKAFLRGLFVSSGNCTIPYGSQSVNTRYHLEMSFSHSAPAMDTAQKLAEHGVNTKITTRKGNYVLYIKSAEEIKNFIAFIGAPVSVLKLTEYIIGGELLNITNRQKNCDLGNVNRQIEASEKQIEAINKIKSERGIEFLAKKDLIETAVARADYPEDTLTELSARLGITKSCLNHRLRKIIAIANTL